MPFETEVMLFASGMEWTDWLEANHDLSGGIWMRIGKKNGGVRSISYEDALEIALCYGWIDALRKSFDEGSFIQRFTPRKPGSKWSVINRERVLILIENGKMQPSGLAAIENAKVKGTWDRAYEPQSTITIPFDFAEELNKSKGAFAFFESLDSQNRYAILHRIQTAIKPETRENRIRKFVAMLEARQKIY
jgi:uncharacterized protein YdeI (YjbR/CyaY-like superfamily)